MTTTPGPYFGPSDRMPTDPPENPIDQLEHDVATIAYRLERLEEKATNTIALLERIFTNTDDTSPGAFQRLRDRVRWIESQYADRLDDNHQVATKTRRPIIERALAEQGFVNASITHTIAAAVDADAEADWNALRAAHREINQLRHLVANYRTTPNAPHTP